MTENIKDNKEIEVEFPEDLEQEKEKISSESSQEKTNEVPKSKKSGDKKGDQYKQKYEDLNEQFLRLRAEFANYKKRMEREQLDLADYVKLEMIKKFLPVLDDFDHMLQKSVGLDGEMEKVFFFHLPFGPKDLPDRVFCIRIGTLERGKVLLPQKDPASLPHRRHIQGPGQMPGVISIDR